jgi:hypothetical protein
MRPCHHNLQFTRRELPTDDRFVQFRGYLDRLSPFYTVTTRTRSVSAVGENSKGRRGSHPTRIELNLVSIAQPFGISIASRINDLDRGRARSPAKKLNSATLHGSRNYIPCDFPPQFPISSHMSRMKILRRLL